MYTDYDFISCFWIISPIPQDNLSRMGIQNLVTGASAIPQNQSLNPLPTFPFRHILRGNARRRLPPRNSPINPPENKPNLKTCISYRFALIHSMNSEYFVGRTLRVPSTPKVYANVPVVVFCPVWTSRTVAFTRTWTLLDSVSGVAVSKSVSLQSVLV